MKKIFNRNVWSALLLGLLVTVSSCVKEDFDTVPPVTYSDLTATTTIKQLRDLYGASPIKELKKISALYPQSFYNDLKSKGLDTALVIKGVVVSSDSAGAYYKSVWIEDGTGGIEISLDSKSIFSTYAFKPGWPVILKVSDLYAKRYENSKGLPVGDIQIGTRTEDGGKIVLGRIEADNVTKFILLSGSRTAENPLTVKISELKPEMIGRLIRIDGVEFVEQKTTYLDAGSTYPSNRTLIDCYENKLTLRTSNYAIFGTMPLPEKNGSIVGVLNTYDGGYQLTIRSDMDVQFVNDRCVAPPVIYSQDFSTFTTGVAVNENGWTSFKLQGTDRDWRVKDYQGNKYPEFSSYGSTSAVNEGWLISPPIDITGYSNTSVKFETQFSYWKHDALTAYVSTDFDGTNVATATWTQLPAHIGSETLGDKYNVWISSGRVSLDNYTGKVFIAFKYVGNNAAVQTSTYRIDNFVVSGIK